MAKPWDKKMKVLFSQAPQDFTEWLLPGAQFNSIVSSELESETLHTDLLFEVTLNEQRTLLHIEFQRRRDAKMAERLWVYNQRASLKYACPVWSVVIYLKKSGSIVEAPLVRKLSTGRTVHWFDFEVIKLWEVPTQELKQKGLTGLLPLLVLTQGGTSREVVEETISELTPPDEEVKAELLTLTYGLASLAFENEQDQEWLSRRFAIMYDMLRETRAFQEIINEGLKEGLEKGLEKGRQVGKIEALRQTLLNIVHVRFPELVQLTKGLAAITEDTEVLDEMVLKVSTAQSFEEAQQYLLEIAEK